MTDIQQENTVPDNDTDRTEAAPLSVGTVLRETRARLGLTVAEVSHHIKFAPRQIEALEADDFEHVPEATFLRGFVRSYARLLQLDPLPLLDALPHAPEQVLQQVEKAQAEAPYPNIYTERKQNIIWLAAALVVAIALALTAWMLGDKQKDQAIPKIAASDAQNTVVDTLVAPNIVPVSAVPEASPDSTPPVTTPAMPIPGSENPAAEKSVVAKPEAEKPVEQKTLPEMTKTTEARNVPQTVLPSAQPAAVPTGSPVAKPAPAINMPGQVAIRMTFDEDSWVEISEKNGKHLLSQLNRAGSELNISGTPPISLVIGNSSAVHLYFKGQAIELASHTKVEVARLTLE
jgi:cytoskeleton protein RodZ